MNHYHLLKYLKKSCNMSRYVILNFVNILIIIK
jgi:hypothetical protein